MATFRKVSLEIKRSSGYGQYIIEATYKGKDIRVRTNDSECYDWLNDESNKEKHLQAKRYAYSKVVNAYQDSCNG